MATPLVKQLRAVTLRKAVYPTITVVLVAATTVCFISSARFLGTSVNRSLAVNTEEGTASPESTFTDFLTVANKLGIATSTEAGTPPAPEAPATTPLTAPATEPTATATTTTSTSDRASVTIALLNSTKTIGLAADLKTILEAAGFRVTKTGNQSPTEAVTLVEAKVNIAANATFIADLRTAVSQKYAPADTQTLAEDSPYDVVVVIGEK